MCVDKPLLSEQQSDNIECPITVTEVKFLFVSIVMQIIVNNAFQIMVEQWFQFFGISCLKKTCSHFRTVISVRVASTEIATTVTETEIARCVFGLRYHDVNLNNCIV